MTPPEMTIAALAYVAALLLGQRVIALGAPEMQEAGFAIAAVVGAFVAAILYQRRNRKRASMQVMLSVGGVLAILAVVVGMFTQQLWESLAAPAVVLPAAAVGTLLLPLAVFPLMHAILEPSAGAASISTTHVVIAAVVAFILAGTAFALPAQARSHVKLVPQKFPGLEISLPAGWQVAEKAALFEFGNVRYDDPSGVGRSLAVHWSIGEPVRPDDYVKLITGNQLPVKERNIAFPGSHEGVTFYLEADDQSDRAFITVWNCTQDHRVLWVSSFLGGSKRQILATHQRIIESIQCHTGGARPTTQLVFPAFVPPPGFTRDQAAVELLFTGPKKQTIVFDAAVGGRSDLAGGDVSPATVEPLIKELTRLNTLSDPPTLRNIRDLHGHERRVWSAAGTTYGGAQLQVEMMVWYCDVRNMTFIGGYATRGKHDVQEGIDALLPAGCH